MSKDVFRVNSESLPDWMENSYLEEDMNKMRMIEGKSGQDESQETQA
jgi:hypothetical protein